MIPYSAHNISLQELEALLNNELKTLLEELGRGRTDGVAYDTAWVARLTKHYAHDSIAAALSWIRNNQYDDGTWGCPVPHYHDRYLSTLAAIVALKDVGDGPDDEERIMRGEDALWRIVGKLAYDDHDTIGFPILSIQLTEEARQIGLEVPQPAVRYAAAYNQRVEQILNQPHRNWRTNTLSFSVEVLRDELFEDDIVFDSNRSVAVSPAATAGYLLRYENSDALDYLLQSLADDGTGAARAVDPIDDFEVVWALNHLRYANLISPDDFHVKRVLEKLFETYNRKGGLGYASYNLLVDVDGTSAGWGALKWAGYPVDLDIFEPYEAEDYFRGFLIETDPALSAQLRLLAALRMAEGEDDPRVDAWIKKIVGAVHWMDNNGSFWTDKWHTSPYYVNSTGIWALYGLDNTLVETRLKWILRTQNSDGGWGYFEESTPEETAYCLESLLWWDKHVQRLDDTILDKAVSYLIPHITDERYTPLWIGKSLYSPHYVVKAAILGAIHRYINREA